jgi:hypothetical protein
MMELYADLVVHAKPKARWVGSVEPKSSGREVISGFHQRVRVLAFNATRIG